MEDEKSDYERTRDSRIKQNLDRMRKLGIFEISMQLKTPSTNPCPKPRKLLDFNTTPLRRSPRLQNAAPVMYPDVVDRRNRTSLKNLSICTEVGLKPEVYTEEHDRSLCRIYDSVRGKTCHQCRQKTLGHRTNCGKCNTLRGQFCGFCLSTRYGENVLEAVQNPHWICPPCRGICNCSICNCSICRRGKGLAPTGLLYREIASLGYKSVAHYLSQTSPSGTDDTNDPHTKIPVRNSLLYDNGPPSSEEDSTNGLVQHSEMGIGRNQGQKVEEVAGENKQESTYMHIAESGLLKGFLGLGTKLESELENTMKPELVSTLHEHNKDTELHLCKKGNVGRQMIPDREIISIHTPPKSGRKRCGLGIEPNLDSIGGRLRLRRKRL